MHESLEVLNFRSQLLDLLHQSIDARVLQVHQPSELVKIRAFNITDTALARATAIFTASTASWQLNVCHLL